RAYPQVNEPRQTWGHRRSLTGNSGAHDMSVSGNLNQACIKPCTRCDDELHVANRSRTQGSLPRLFAFYAGILLVPVLILGLLLSASYRSEARQRGLAEGQSEARL